MAAKKKQEPVRVLVDPESYVDRWKREHAEKEQEDGDRKTERIEGQEA